MTTGPSGTYATSYGIIEFTHTDRAVENILEHTLASTTRPLRLANKQTAWRDLKGVGRNTQLLISGRLKMVDQVDVNQPVLKAMESHDWTHMRPVVEKELLHYDILFAKLN